MCEPEIVNSYREYDYTEDDGTIETSIAHDYNCHFCENKDCQYWSEYN